MICDASVSGLRSSDLAMPGAVRPKRLFLYQPLQLPALKLRRATAPEIEFGFLYRCATSIPILKDRCQFYQ
jgi:hypothetical protein